MSHEAKAEDEARAISIMNSYRIHKPKKTKASLKAVPNHLKSRRDRRPLPQRMGKPVVEKPTIPDFLKEMLNR